MLSSDLIRHLETLHEGAYGWALLCCDHDRERAADVLQTSYARLLDGRAAFTSRGRPDASLRAFLFGVVRRVALEHIRRDRRVRPLDAGTLPEEPDPAPTPLAEMLRQEVQRDLRAALLRLSSRQREVLHLVFYQGLTLAASADILGIGVGSARQHYERGKHALRHLCAQYAGGPDEA